MDESRQMQKAIGSELIARRRERRTVSKLYRELMRSNDPEATKQALGLIRDSRSREMFGIPNSQDERKAAKNEVERMQIMNNRAAEEVGSQRDMMNEFGGAMNPQGQGQQQGQQQVQGHGIFGDEDREISSRTATSLIQLRGPTSSEDRKFLSDSLSRYQGAEMNEADSKAFYASMAKRFGKPVARALARQRQETWRKWGWVPDR